MATSFIGRADELVALREMLAATRILTLVGVGGAGKTRLALEVARGCRSEFRDGVWFVELAAVPSETLVAAAALSATGGREDFGHGPAASLVNHLAGRRALVVLDNCEHVIAGAAEVADQLVRSCPEVRVLATSREPLAVAGEVTWPVPPLAVPVADLTLASVDDIASWDSVRLFLDRARQVRPDFSPTGDELRVIGGICRRLDGIPLALELAAARTRVLTLGQIEEGLADRFRLLTGGTRTALPRQQTMRASVDWSHDLLSEAERVVFRRLGAFADRFSLEAAEAVAGATPVRGVDVLDLVGALVERSLVVADTSGGAARYRLLETVRQYARERLGDAGELPATMARHAKWHLELVEAVPGAGTADEWASWAARVESVLDDVLASIEWARGHDVDLAGRVAAATFRLWRLRGRVFEGLRLLEAVGEPPDPQVRASVHEARAALRVMDFQAHPEDRTRVSAALDAARAARDAALEARCLATAGWLEIDGQGQRALGLLRAAAEAARALGDDWTLATALYGIGFLHYLPLADLATALAALHEAVEVASRAGDEFIRLRAAFGLASCDDRLGRLADSRAAFLEAAASARATGDAWSEALALAAAGRMAVKLGDHEGAAALVAAARDLAARDGRASLAFVWTVEATLATALGRGDDALELWARADANDSAALPYVAGMWAAGAPQAHLLRGDLTAARASCDEILRLHEGVSAGGRLVGTLTVSAAIARAEGDLERAEADLRRAIATPIQRTGATAHCDMLHTFAGVLAATGAAVPATRIYGAVAAARQRTGYVMFAREQRVEAQDLVELTEQLGAEAFAAAWREGETMSLPEAIAYAGRGRGTRRRPAAGWSSLTATERQVVDLVAQGLSNPDIAERLFMARRTVTTHLTHVFAKLGLRSRTELAAEAVRRASSDPSRRERYDS